MRLKRILLPALCLLAVVLVALPAVHAQSFGLDAAAPSSLKGNKDLLATIGRLIQTVLSYLGVLFLILMLYSGFLYMTARGDDKKIDTAKKIISGAVTGLIIIAASYALTAFVINAVAGSASGSGSASDPNGPTPITVDTNECTTRTCTTASDCSVPGNLCYTGTCECLGEGDPSIGSAAQPCSFGLCGEAP